MSEITALQPVEAGVPLSATQLKARLAVIQSVMRDVMKDGSDYGIIPGTDKPTLYKPGAEKLCVTFRLSAGAPEIEAVPEFTGDIRYRVRVPLSAFDGSLLAVGVGECSTGEEKYRWRRPVHENEWNAAAEDMRREKFTRQGDVWKQVRVTPADVANTVLKMAHKRAYVHATIMATAAGAIFTQDIEDLPEGVAGDETDQRRQPVQPPQRKAEAKPPTGAGSTVEVKVRSMSAKEGTNANGAWKRTTILAADGKAYSTFDAKHAETAALAQKDGLPLAITFTEGKYGRDVVSLALVERDPGAEG